MIFPDFFFYIQSEGAAQSSNLMILRHPHLHNITQLHLEVSVQIKGLIS